MNLAGEVFIREIMETGGTVVPEVWISRLIRVIENVIRESGLPEKRILGMGIGMPGILDEDSGKVLFSPDFKWENVDMLTPIRERFKMDITIENANRALAMGEYYFGAGVDSRNF